MKFQPNGTKHSELNDQYADKKGGSVKVKCDSPNVHPVCGGSGKAR